MALSLSLLPLLGEAWADVLVVRGQAKPMVGTVVAEQEDRVTIAIKDAEAVGLAHCLAVYGAGSVLMSSMASRWQWA